MMKSGEKIDKNDHNQYYIVEGASNDASSSATRETLSTNETSTPPKGGDGSVSETQQEVTKKLWNPKGW